MLPFLTGLIAGLVIGFCAGAAASGKIVKRQPGRDPFAVPHGWERKS